MPRYRYRKPRRPKRKLYKSKAFWSLFFFLLFFGSAFYFAFFSDLLKVKNIEVSGNQKLGADDVRNALLNEVSKKIFFFIPKNIFAVNFDKLSNDIVEKFPEIEKVSIKINLPNTVSAEIIEKTPVGCWCNNGECFYFDKYGIAYQKNDNCSNLLKIISDKKSAITKEIISAEHLKDILSIYNDAVDSEQIKDIIISDDKITLESKQGWVAYFKPYDDISSQVINLKAVLGQKLTANKISQLNYIDLRFGNKIFYKFKNDELRN